MVKENLVTSTQFRLAPVHYKKVLCNNQLGFKLSFLFSGVQIDKTLKIRNFNIVTIIHGKCQLDYVCLCVCGGELWSQ